MLHRGRLRGSKCVECGDGAFGACHVELAAEPVFRLNGPELSAVTYLVLELLDVGGTLGRGEIQQQVHGTNAPGLGFIPFLPQVHDWLAHLGKHGGSEEFALLQSTGFDERVERFADSGGGSGVGEVGHGEHGNAVFGQP